MAKLTLSNVANISGAESAAIGVINANSDAIEAALENTLSRDGTIPNSMGADLDMDNNDILNVDNIDVNTLTIDGAPVFPEDLVTTDPDAFLSIIGGSDAGIDGFKFDFNTVALLIADTVRTYSNTTAGDYIRTRSEGFAYKVAASGASDHHVTTGGGIKLYVMPIGNRMYASAFGIAGDGSDQTALLQKLFSAGQGHEIRMGRAQTYLMTEEATLGFATELDLRGSTLNFGCVGSKRNLALVGNGAKCYGGTVKNVEGTSGLEGTLQTPITIARYPLLPGELNVTIENMTVETVCPGGNGIAVFGDTSNVSIRNIVFPDSTYLGIPILAHWSFNEDWVTVPPKTTTHQRNIVIENIECGDLTYTTGTEGVTGICAIFLSAAYNARVSNVNIKSMPHGSAVGVYAGDWGFQYSTAMEEAFGSSGIVVENIRGSVQTGLFVSMPNTLDAPLVLWPSRITVRHMHVQGQGSLTNLGRGVRVNGGHHVLVEDSTFDGFYYGVTPEADAIGLEVYRCTIKNSYKDGLINGSNTTPFTLRDSYFEGNNTSASASVADVNLQNTVGSIIEGNNFNSTACQWNIRASNTVSKLRVLRNNSDGVSASGPCYSFGSGSDFGILEEFQGNSSSASPSGGVRAGQTWVPTRAAIASGAANKVTHEYSGPGLPTTGTYVAGDTVICDNVGSAGAIVSGVCRAAGSPGTWNVTAQSGQVGGVGATPLFVGQYAVAGGIAYMATGTASSADWKQIS